ncbi:MAG: acyl-CoA desaturase, partial [Rhodocyclaceae bacterium]
ADASRNIVPWGILIGGEELHNNHHAYMTSAKLSNKWFEFDIGWSYIRIMEMLRMARVRKLAPNLHFSAKQVIDVETLQAVIAHRYDVLARFLKSLQSLVEEECARMTINARESRLLKRLLKKDTATLILPQREVLGTLLARSDQLSKVYAMRTELEALWVRSTANHDQLVEHLRDWVSRAEASGILQLEEFSRRLRQYSF